LKLQNKFPAVLLPAGLLAAALMLLLIQRSVHAVIIGGFERGAISLARAAAQEAAPGLSSGRESELLPQLQDLQRREGALYAAALGPDGRIVAHTTVTEKGKVAADEPTQAALRSGEPSLWRESVEGAPVLFAVVPVRWPETRPPGEQYILTGNARVPERARLGALKIAVSLTPARETEERIIREISLIVAAIGAVMFGLVFLLVRGMLAPIRGLMSGISRIGGGQYDVQIPVLSRDELGDLARSFNIMSGELARTTVSKEYVESILENMNDLLVVTDPQGRIQTINHAAAAALGAAPEEVIGRPLASLFSEPPPEADAARDAEVLLRTKDGRATPALFSSSVLRARDGELRGYVGVARDITERKRAEKALIAAKLAAEASSRELEAFSYSVAHDLRAPLRSVDGFSQALLEKYADKLDEEGKDYLKRVRLGSRKMSQLIDDLLNLSRITRSVMRLESVDLSALAKDIASELSRAEPGRRVEFVVAPRLITRGDANLLRIALVNLLGNSWKYTSKHPRARIEFGAEDREGKRVYFVRDDGAGFDMAFSKRLFQPFSRLHATGEFEGTGIGLATVQRVIARHEGRIWGEAAVERGAVFYFTLWERKP
jgi:PAS domain S-box-containing protein